MLLAVVGFLAQTAAGAGSATGGVEVAAPLGEGYVVWESNRSGSWRIWHCRLDGSDLRQLSPDEKDRDHFCPHISPDGRKIVYLSYPRGKDGYNPVPKSMPCPLHLIAPDGTGDRVIAPNARAYFEDRAAVWMDDNRLMYIGGDGMTYVRDFQTGGDTPVTRTAHGEFGFLMDRMFRFGVQGRPDFGVYDRVQKTICPLFKNQCAKSHNVSSSIVAGKQFTRSW
ncbi:MAG: hypothetical protein R6X19_00825 [Kiritimatiellia bacterium]